MTKHIALLRGINVGGNKKVEMKKLAEVFVDLGFSSVTTYINSGNVIFNTNESENLQSIIETALFQNFEFEIKVVIRDSENIKKICAEVPVDWINDSKQKTDVIFLWDEFNHPKTLELIEQNPKVDRLLYIKGCIVWNIQKADYSKSKMSKFIGTKVYKNITARNINTVRNINEILNSI